MKVQSNNPAPLRAQNNPQPPAPKNEVPEGPSDKLSFSGDKGKGPNEPPVNWRKAAYAAAYIGLPAVAGYFGGGGAALGSMALGVGAGVYAARDMGGREKFLLGFSGLCVASAANSIGSVAHNPSLGGLLYVALGAYVIGTSGKQLMEFSN